MAKKVAIVVQRYGKEVVGGAEGLALSLAEHMQGHWDVTVITTCARDYRTWENSYKEGKDKVGGVSVIRFPVDRPRDFDEFSQHTYKAESHTFRLTPEEEKDYFEKQGPFVPKLTQYLEDSYDDYDVFLFFTYLYYPTVMGIPKVADKAYLITTAHDESPFYFVRSLAPIFASLKGIIYLAPEEQDLINQVYQVPEQVRQIPGGYGVPGPAMLLPPQQVYYLTKYRWIFKTPYLVYVGRVTPTKRCYEMIDTFNKMVSDYGIKSKLILVGPLDMDLPEDSTNVVSLGPVSEKVKSFLLRHARALVNPSSLESLSMVTLEAWMHKIPVIINGESAVMRGNCDRSGGGLYYFSSSMCKGLMAWALGHKRECKALGGRGRTFVESNFSWQKVRKTLLNEVV